jgi:hypothetical protein
LTRKDELEELPLLSNAKRLAIAFDFERLGAPDNTQEDSWSVIGLHCVSAIVRKNLFLSLGTNTITIFQEYLDCKYVGLDYTGERLESVGSTDRRPNILCNNSVEA